MSVNMPVWHIWWDENPALPAPLRSLGISRPAGPAAGAAVLAGAHGLHGSTALRCTVVMPAHHQANTPKLSLYFCNTLSTDTLRPVQPLAHLKCRAQSRSVCSPCTGG